MAQFGNAVTGAVCPVWHRQTTDATREDSGRGGHDDRTTPQQQPHSPGTSRAVTVRPAGGGETTKAPGPKPHGSLMVSPPHPLFLHPPSHPQVPPVTAGSRH